MCNKLELALIELELVFLIHHRHGEFAADISVTIKSTKLSVSIGNHMRPSTIKD